MSREVSIAYEMERQRRETIYRERVGAQTEQFYNRYKQQYEEMLNKGYRNYIPDEIKDLENNLSRIRNLLTSDPMEAREISMEVGACIHAYWTLAQVAEEQFAREARMRRERIKEERKKQQGSLLDAYYDALKNITNPIVINFASSGLDKIKKDIQFGVITSSSDILAQVKNVVNASEKNSTEWKTKKEQQSVTAGIDKEIQEQKESLGKEKIENKVRADELLAQLESLQNNVRTGATDSKTAANAIKQIVSDIDEQITNETVRREMVKVVMKELKSLEFTVSAPTIKNGYVIIKAKKPSGKQAVFHIDLDGKMKYRLDKYEGKTCLQDIEKFNIDLNRVYSVHLSDERVIWENPDRIYKDAEGNFQSGGRHA